MQIRSDDVYWPIHDPRHFTKMTPLAGDLKCDVAIIGGGITGALVAHHLISHGMDVAVFDRSQPCAGSTAACTALVQYELDQPLVSIAKLHNLEHATRAYQTCVASLDWLKEHVDGLNDSCELQERSTLLLAKRSRDLLHMRQEVDARREAGIDVSLLENDALREQFNIKRPGAIFSPRSYELNPYALTRATLESAVKMGAHLFSPVEIVSAKPNENGVSLLASHGPMIQAKYAILATGYETKQFTDASIGDISSTWAAVSEPIDVDKYWPQKQLMWEWGSAYLYARLTSDSRVIFGGGDRKFITRARRDAIIEKTTNQLKKQVEKLIPGLKLTIAHAWAGEFASTPDGMPYIGPCKKCSSLYLALGYGGNGITFSLIAARILTGILCDIPKLREPADLFRFDR